MSLLAQRYSGLEKFPFVRYDLIEKSFSGFQGKTMPISFRMLVQAELSQQTVTRELPLGDNRHRHVKAFFAGTLGAAFTAVARIIRVLGYTLFMPLALPIRWATATHYGFTGAVPELLHKWGEEFVDAGVTLLCVPLGLVKTIRPQAFSGLTQSITEHYLARADRRDAYDQKFAEAQRAYTEQEQASARKVAEARE